MRINTYTSYEIEGTIIVGEGGYNFHPEFAVDIPDELWERYKKLRAEVSQLENEMYAVAGPAEEAYYDKLQLERDHLRWVEEAPLRAEAEKARLEAEEAKRLRGEEKKRKAAERKILGDVAIDPKFLTPEALEKRRLRKMKKELIAS
jgi:hypothetical protein